VPAPPVTVALRSALPVVRDADEQQALVGIAMPIAASGFCALHFSAQCPVGYHR
jgi:hypothetical protein